MAKMTAAMFGELPDELQQEILSKVPAQHLSEIEMISSDDMNEQEVGAKVAELLMGLSRRESLVCIMQLIASATRAMLPPDVPPPMQMAADLAVLEKVVAQSRAIVEEADEDGE